MKTIQFMMTCAALTFLSVLGSGCAKEKEFSKVEVLKLIPLDETEDPASVPRFKMQAEEFSSLKSLSPLKGDYFEMIEGGTLNVKSIAGSIVVSDGFKGGKPVGVRYHVSDRVAIPDDYESLLKLSAFYQFDQITRDLGPAVGFSREDLKREHGILRILFYPSIHADLDEVSGTITIRQNAAFDPSRFQFLIMPSGDSEKVPLGASLQVLAHEFGHLIFQKIFGDGRRSGLKEEDHWLDHDVMRGLNEGFADFFSYVLTGSTNVLGSSLPSYAKDRNFSKIRFNFQNRMSSNFYTIGTVFAQSMYRLHGEGPSTAESRRGFFRTLVNRLIRARAVLDADSEVQGIRTNSDGSSLSDEAAMRKFLRAMMDGIAPAEETAFRNAIRDLPSP